MECRIALLLLLLPLFGNGQDTITNDQQYALIKRFESIVGDKPSTVDSVQLLKGELYTLKSDVATMQESILRLQRQQDKELLIETYGEPGKWVIYDSKQKKIFGTNLFLKELNSNDKGCHVYLAFNETQTDFSVYNDQFLVLVNQWKANTNLKIHLDGYSDTWGRNKHNVYLSRERSLQVMKYLVSQFSIPEDAFRIVYYGAKGENRIKEKELDFLNRQVYVEVK